MNYNFDPGTIGAAAGSANRSMQGMQAQMPQFSAPWDTFLNSPDTMGPYPWMRILNLQNAANQRAFQDTLRTNLMDQNTPFGSVSYDFDARGMPSARNVSLTPGLQSAYDNRIGFQNQLAQALGSRMGGLNTINTQNLPAISALSQQGQQYTGRGTPTGQRPQLWSGTGNVNLWSGHQGQRPSLWSGQQQELFNTARGG